VDEARHADASLGAPATSEASGGDDYFVLLGDGDLGPGVGDAEAVGCPLAGVADLDAVGWPLAGGADLDAVGLPLVGVVAFVAPLPCGV
jgi:hypothetical protein